jgi:recombinase-like zinc beta ribbon protein
VFFYLTDAERKLETPTDKLREKSVRPPADWPTVDAPQLRIVTDAQWDAAQHRIAATSATYVPDSHGHMGGRPPSGIDAKHLLTGLATCATCGGGFLARRAGRLSSGKRKAYYICTAFNNHGACACANNVPLQMQVADAAVLSTFAESVLRQDIVEGAILDAVQLLRPTSDSLDVQRGMLQGQLVALEEELARLAAIAAGGHLPALLEALQDRDRRRAHVREQLDRLNGLRQVTDFDVPQVERELRAKLADWRGLLQRHAPLSRQILANLLDGRLVFTPRPDRTYEFAGKVQFGKFLKGIVSQQVFDRFVDATAQKPYKCGLCARRRFRHCGVDEPTRYSAMGFGGAAKAANVNLA